MKKIYAFKPFIVAVFLVLAFKAFASENIRVTKAFEARIDSALSNDVSLSIGYNDGILIVLPKDLTFIKAVEIEVKLPTAVLNFPSSMAYALYTTQHPESPIEKTVDFSGQKLVMEVLPPKITFTMQVPLRKNHGLKTDPYTEVLAEIPPENGLPLFFRLLPIMKGLPDNFERALFSVKIKPILADEGGLVLSIALPDNLVNNGNIHGSRLSVRIDEKSILEPEKMQLLSHGEHHLAVSADKCRTEVRTFTIERGKITRLSVEMKDAAPTVSFVSPSNVQVLLDGKPVANPRGMHKIETGRHTVMFSVGDFSVQRQFSAEEGKDYSVSMIVDAEIVELQ